MTKPPDLPPELTPLRRESCHSPSTSSSCAPARALEDGHGVLVCAPTGAGKTVVGEFAVHLALAAGRKCFYTTPIKALEQPEAHRSGAPVRRRAHRPADGRPVDQRRRSRGRHDHRGAAQHAVREFDCAAGAFACRDGRGALPRRPDARRGVGGGDPAPVRGRATGQPVGDGEQRRGVRRLDPDRARRHHRRRRRAPARPAVAAHDGRQAAVRPLRRRPAGRAAPHWWTPNCCATSRSAGKPTGWPTGSRGAAVGQAVETAAGPPSTARRRGPT